MRFPLPLKLHTKILSGRKKRDPNLPWILIVAHEASRTGAPIVAQNLADVLSGRYNVVLYSQKGGPILEAFRDACVEVCLPRRVLPKLLRAKLSIAALTNQRPFRFAILNSAETHPASVPLERAGVPVVAIMHEFAAYLGKHQQIRQWFEKARAVVFSSTLTRDDAARLIGLPAGVVTILPQGKCIVPGASGHDNPSATRELATLLRPEGRKSFLVLGAGSVEYRKGVDLFVSLAAMARVAAPEIPWRFIWIGGHLTGFSSGDYRLYIADQIRRCEVSDILSVLPSTPDIETAYRSADLFLLPSRLDPLPNVAIDALAAGLPVLSFDRATGLAELKRSAALDEPCLAPYLDLTAMADRIVALARSPDLCRTVGEASARLAQERFRMDEYAWTLADLAESVASDQRG